MGKHDEAIALLERLGFCDVTRRQWALGDCVVVPLGRKDTQGISVWPEVAFLVPSNSGWDLVRSLRQHEWRKHFTDVELACTALRDIAERFAFPDRCSCGGELDARVGERVQDTVRLWCSTHCLKCGARAEMDGRGEMPGDLREWLIVREGRWKVTVTELATTETWKRAREVLKVAIDEIAELRRTPNARIFSGTFGMATWTAREVGEAVVTFDEA